MDRRALFERNELARPLQARVRPILMRPDGASLVLGPFAETKGPRPPGRNPAYHKFKKFLLVHLLGIMVFFSSKHSEVNGNSYNSYKSEGLICLPRIRARVYPSWAGDSSWSGCCEQLGRPL